MFLDKLFVLLFFIELSYSFVESNSVIVLPNEQCLPRKALIAVDAEGYRYFPLVIELYRCGGACGNSRFNATSRRCVKKEAVTLQIFAFDELAQVNETLQFENHTKCGCECKDNGTSCSITQKWDPNQCKCVCDPDAGDRCPEFHRFNPSTCQCQCELSCPERRRSLNTTSCSCYCPDKFYVKCSKKDKLLRETDCKCITPSPLINENDHCDVVPTKWAVVIITVSFCAFFILAFDCVLYGRKTGCIFLSLHICHKEKEETMGIVKGARAARGDTFETNI